jgi:hypothetical protein
MGSESHVLKNFLEVYKHHFGRKLSNKFKNGHEKFSGVRVFIVEELLAWIA